MAARFRRRRCSVDNRCYYRLTRTLTLCAAQPSFTDHSHLGSSRSCSFSSQRHSKSDEIAQHWVLTTVAVLRRTTLTHYSPPHYIPLLLIIINILQTTPLPNSCCWLRPLFRLSSAQWPWACMYLIVMRVSISTQS